VSSEDEDDEEEEELEEVELEDEEEGRDEARLSSRWRRDSNTSTVSCTSGTSDRSLFALYRLNITILT